MVSPVFSQEQTCPVCSTNFKVQRVRSSTLRVLRRDTDFCVIYEGVNPLIYSVWVCPECHYAATDQHFHNPLSDFQLDRLKKGLSLFKGEEPDFSGERSWDTVIRSYELAIRTAQIYHAKASYMGALFLRAAWACRFAGKQTQEKEFITGAADQYQKAYEGEHDARASEAKMLYLIGELNRRAGRPKEAIMWFSRAVRHPGIKREAEVDRLTRDQWLLAKNEAKDLADSEETGPEDTKSSGEQPEPLAVAPNLAAPSGTVNASPSGNRPLVNMLVNLYQDQVTWLQGITNKAYEKHHRLLEKAAVVRAVLDAFSQVEIPAERLQNEDALREYLVQTLSAPTRKTD